MQHSIAAVALSHWFGIERGSAAVLVALLVARGAPVSREALSVAAFTTENCVKTRICEIRGAMNCEAVDTLRGCYALTETGLAECRSALYQLAAEIAESAAPLAMVVELAA